MKSGNLNLAKLLNGGFGNQEKNVNKKEEVQEDTRRVSANCDYLSTRLQELGLSGVADKLRTICDTPKEEIPPFFSESGKSVNDIKYPFISATGLESFQSKYPSRLDVIEASRAADQLAVKPTFRFRSFSTGGKYLTYIKYIEMKDKCSEKIQDFMTSTLFTDISGGLSTTIDYDELFAYMDTIAAGTPHLKILMSYDVTHSGIITIDGFKSYVQQMASGIRFVEELTKSDPEHLFFDMYVDYVTSVVFFNLDPLNTGNVSIDKLIRDPKYQSFIMIDPANNVNDKNIFGPIYSKNMIDRFTRTCSSNDGILTVDDIMHMSEVRWCRVFCESLISRASPQPDFAWFVRVMTAYESEENSASKGFFFDVMDFNQDGIITIDDLELIYDEVSREFLNCLKYPAPSLQWFVSELFDMCGVTDGNLTREIFINCQKVSSYIRPLIDINVFICNNRDYE